MKRPELVPRGETAAALIRDMYGRLVHAGLDEACIARQTGLRPDDLADPDARFPTRLRIDLWLLALRCLDQPEIGLRTAVDVEPQDLGIAGYIALNSATLGEACHIMGRFQRLICDDDCFTHVIEADHSVLVYDIDSPPECRRQIIENVLACHCVIVRKLTGGRVDPLAVHFGFDAPRDGSLYRDVFRCPVTFGRERNALFYRCSVYETPLPGANRYLCKVTTDHAERLLAALRDVSANWSDRVRGKVAARLASGRFGIDDIARALGLSRRTLQRRLDAEATVFSALVAEVQYRRALEHMSDRALSLGEIAVLAGFSEPGAFHRAFRRQAGCGPQEYRRLLGGR